jgi:hypothetical protein
LGCQSYSLHLREATADLQDEQLREKLGKTLGGWGHHVRRKVLAARPLEVLALVVYRLNPSGERHGSSQSPCIG